MHPLAMPTTRVQATVVSPWIVQHEALEPFMCQAPAQEPTPLPYLSSVSHTVPDIHMVAAVRPQGSAQAYETCHSHFRDVYWTFQQMLAHHTIGGCNIRAGDIIASGTVSSSADADSCAAEQQKSDTVSCSAQRTCGCLLELTRAGKHSIELATGVQRKWLHDGDTVEMHAWCEAASMRLGFGPCHMQLVPAFR